MRYDKLTQYEQETCDCNDCSDTDVPCNMDCDEGPCACQGCLEAREADMDRMYDIMNAKGLL